MELEYLRYKIKKDPSLFYQYFNNSEVIFELRLKFLDRIKRNQQVKIKNKKKEIQNF
jgi:hypothetical protein